MRQLCAGDFYCVAYLKALQNDKANGSKAKMKNKCDLLPTPTHIYNIANKINKF